MIDTLSVLTALAAEVRRATHAGPAPEAMPRLPRTRLCVGMTTFEDFDGVYFTVQAMRMSHPEVLADTSFLIIDNSPEGPNAFALRDLAASVPNCRYVPFSGYQSTAVRDLLFRETDADILLCVDSHVLLAPGALRAVLDYFEAHPDSRDLVQGPLLDDHFRVLGTHFDPAWGAGMFGRWAFDPRANEPDRAPFQIPMQGLGVFACRRAAWPGINPRFRGFGGEEGYLHEKIRQAGGQVVCLPALAWVHRFARPGGVPYENIWAARIRNYLLGWEEIGWDTAEVETHFRELLGDVAAQPLLSRARRQLQSPFSWFDGILVSAESDAAWAGLEERAARLDLVWRLERVRSFREGVDDARRRGYRRVLLLDTATVFLDDSEAVLAETIAELATRPWDLLCLGRDHRAVALNRDAIERLSNTTPADHGDGLTEHDARFLARLADARNNGAYRVIETVPRIASHPDLLVSQDAVLAERYGV